MKHHASLHLFLPMVLFFSSLLWSQKQLGIFDQHTDIGDCKYNGNAVYDQEKQTYQLSGAGTNMWFGQDEFHYAWTTIQGDFILRAEVSFIGEGVDPHRKVGWMVRNTLDANASHVNATSHGDGLTSLQYRTTVAGNTEEVISTDTFPDVIQLERKGNTYIMSTAKFGEEFTSVQLNSEALDNEVYVGIYVCAHNPEVIEKATYRNVRIVKPAPEDLVPYESYLGSHMETLDIDSGHRQILYSSAHSIQAPNWTPDGEKLIYNSKGYLYNYDLIKNKISPLNTGFATRNNNDHVLSFDGSLLGISHHNPEDNGNSALYYLPTGGDSIPTLVTKSGVG